MAPVAGRRRPASGFTLIELMIVLIIVAILAALAGPSFRDFIISQRIKTTSFDLFADLNYARSEAVRTNSEVIIARAGSSWTGGWSVTWVDPSNTNRTLRSHPALDGTITITGNLSQVKFERNGRPVAGTAAATFTLDDAAGKWSIKARCITLDTSGRPNIVVGACP
jgi:type IV fimbrial biogenesis protein FimT